ncbi:carbohydrate ABC transporter permease [Paenibacillus sp. GD4]|uniref:carbohydrate ABC transporter permease n=1 Tax=Paenibacillus sp. GD4 TaxID=3068890 RepID=UPI0027965184|nr:carbohydrate ABC transporter permease [Paenibacillus sp. GD4]MDQ1914242.1 carbohydrate ABC transporter permease [Paenibacillus sp. GD4]
MVRDRTLSSRLLDGFTHLLMLVVLAVVILPILHIVSVSLSSPDQIVQGRIGLWPKQLDVNAYATIFREKIVPRALMNSVLITTLGTCLNVVLTTLTAYAISKKELPFRRSIVAYILVTMFFSGGLIPTFLVVKELGMYNSLGALIVPTAINAYYLIILHAFFKNFPSDLEESAKLDGCTDFGIFMRIVLPLSKAGVATIALFYIVAHWNSFFSAMIYLQDAKKWPLQLVLREIVLQSQMAEQLAQLGQSAQADQASSKITIQSIQYATLVVSIIPMVIVYPFVQKYFVQGVMIGSLKG